jgi:hypothetical protein
MVSLYDIFLQSGSTLHKLSLSAGIFKLYNETSGLGNEIALPRGFVVTHDSDNLQITNQGDKNASANQKITTPYGTDLRNLPYFESRVARLEITSFHQSIIDNIIMANLYGNLYDKITDGQKYPVIIKTLVGDDIYPKTTNTILTVYYSSYIDTVFPKDTITSATNNMFTYLTNSSTIIMISIINSTKVEPKIIVTIHKLDGETYKRYEATRDVPKVTIDLTVDFAAARSEPVEITSLQFRKPTNPTRTADEFYQDCINILGNMFISYSYED